jgi:thiamine kinase-like enzyme
VPRPPMPESFADVTPEWLTSALREGGSLKEAAVTGCQKETIGVGVGFMSQLARCDLTLDRTEQAAPRSLIAKLPTPSPENRAIADLFNFYEVETGFYRDLAAKTPVRTPACYYSDFAPAAKNFVLLMEEMNPSVADQVHGCSQAQTEEAVRGLARLHTTWWSSPELESLTWLPWNNDPVRAGAAQASYQMAWGPFSQIVGSMVPKEILELGERFAPKVVATLDKLAESPWTLVHGDYRLDNLFFGPDGSLAVVDWQIISRGPAAFDLAYFMTGSVRPEDRKAWEMDLLRGYHESLMKAGVRDYSFERLFEDYRRGVLFSFLYAVIIIGQMDISGDRGRALFEASLERTVTAIIELEAAEMLP